MARVGRTFPLRPWVSKAPPSSSLPPLTISVSDSTTTSESLNLLETSFIHASDSTTTSESLTLLETSFISVSDSTTTSESITLDEVNLVSVSDVVTTADTRTNLIPNPSFEADTVGNGNNPGSWTSYQTNSGSPTYEGVANDWSEYGSQSFKLAFASAGGAQLYYNLPSTIIGQTVTFSAWVKTDANVTNANLTIYDNGATNTTTVGANNNSRISVTRTLTGGGTISLALCLGDYGSTSIGTAWFDGVMVEFSPTANSYFDGSFPGAVWTGTANASTSQTSNQNVQMLETSLISVSDPTTTSETLTELETSFISVSDSTTTSETINVATCYCPSVSDSTTTSETITLVLVDLPSVSDSTTTSENLTLLETSFVSVSDSTTTSESLVLLETGFISVSDSTTTSETINVALVNCPNVSDSTTTSENITLLETSFVPVSDSTTTSESLTLLEVSFVNVSDSTTTSESVTVIEPLSVSVSDSTTTSETINVALVNCPSVSDSTTTSETIDVLGVLLINLSGPASSIISEYTTTTVSSILNLYNGNYTGVATLVTGNGLATGNVEWYIASVGSPTGNIVAKVYNVASNLPTGTALASSNAISASSISTSNSFVTFTFPAPYTLANGTTYAISLEYSGGDATDFIKVGGGVNNSNSDIYFFSGSWGSTTGYEFAYILNSAQYGEFTTTSESLQLDLIPQISVSDSTTTSEALTLLETSFVNVSDSTTTSESITVQIVSSTALQINVSDATTTSETLTLLETSFVSVSDSTTTSETVTVTLVSLVSVYDGTQPQEARTNLISNPSFEADTVGNGNIPANWSAYNSSGSQTYKGVSSTFSEYGSNSFEISASSNTDTGMYMQITGLPMGATVTLSVWVNTTSVTNATIVLDTQQHGLAGHSQSNTNQNGTVNQRVSTSLVLDTTGVNVFLGLGSFGAQSAGTVYFDGVMLEVSTVNGTYFDGSSSGAQWSGTSGQSTSFIPFWNVAIADQISVSDSTTTSESIELLVTSFINVSDSTTTSESITMLMTSFVNVSDSTTTSESVTVVLVTAGTDTVIVSDSTSTSESLTLLETSFVNVSDSTTTSETLNVVEFNQISVSDSTTTNDSLDYALLFNGSNFVQVKSGSGILSGGSNYSIAVMFAGSAALGANGGSLYAERSSASNDIIEIRVAQSNVLQFLRRDDAGTLDRHSGTTNVQDGNPHSAVVVMSGGSTLNVYLDGNSTPEITATLLSTTTQTNSDIKSEIGQDAAGTGYIGAIDNVQLYTRAVSTTEVAQYNSSSSVYSNTSLVGWWKFNEGTGTSTADSSTGGNTGTLSGTPTWIIGLSPTPRAQVELDAYPVVSDSTTTSENLTFLETSFINVSDSTTTSEGQVELDILFVSVSDSASTSESVSVVDTLNIISPQDYVFTTRTNLVTWSQALSHWIINGATTVTDNVYVSPDSTTDADSISGSVNNDGVFRNITSTPVGSVVTFSVYLQYISGATNWTIGTDLTDGGWVKFNIQTQSVISTNSAIASSITSAGGGWYRYTVTVITAIVTTPAFTIYSQNAGSSYVAAVWGAQAELGYAASTYIPTNASIATVDTGETYDVELDAYPSVSDGTTTSESLILLETSFISVSDSTSTSEGQNELDTLNISVADSTTTFETINVALVNAPNVSDSTVTSESRTLLQTSFINVIDSTTTSEGPSTEEDEYIHVSDSTVTSETVTVKIQGIIAISVSDSTTLSESVSVEFQAPSQTYNVVLQSGTFNIVLKAASYSVVMDSTTYAPSYIQTTFNVILPSTTYNVILP